MAVLRGGREFVTNVEGGALPGRPIGAARKFALARSADILSDGGAQGMIGTGRYRPAAAPAGLAAFVGTELGPDREMIGDLLGRFELEVEFRIRSSTPEELVNSTVARRSKRMLSVRRVPRSVEGVPVTAGVMPGTSPSRPRWFSSASMSPKQDHVVFGPLLVVADRAEHVGQRVEFVGRPVGAHVDVDRREGERLASGSPRTRNAATSGGRRIRPAVSTACNVPRSISRAVWSKRNAVYSSWDRGPRERRRSRRGGRRR